MDGHQATISVAVIGTNQAKPVDHGEHGVRSLKELGAAICSECVLEEMKQRARVEQHRFQCRPYREVCIGSSKAGDDNQTC
jgi:hypothetical protein